MCGRFYVDDEMMDEIGRICRQIGRGQGKTGTAPPAAVRMGDVHPSEAAFVLRAEKRDNGILGVPFIWGYEAQGKLIINARCETVRERPLFRRDYEEGRCVVPAQKFYEWTAGGKGEKEQYDFFGSGGPLFMAGICRPEEGGGRFAILTTEANESVREIHSRMPVLLREEEIGGWLRERNTADRILERVPALLKRKRSGGAAGKEEYSQLKLF